jgi:aryl carrier-like protein
MADVPGDRLFTEAVAGAPDAVVLDGDDGDTIDRGTLAARAEELAGRLDAGSVVAVCCPTDIEQTVATLAVWRAGAACLPLDVRHPRARLQSLVRDAGAATVLGTGLDPAPHPARAHLTAAVLRLAGTFVRLPAGDLLDRIARMRDSGLVSPDDRVLRMSSPALDAALWERVWPLATGARSVAVAPHRHADLDHLTGLIDDQRITVVQCEPSWLHRLAGQEWAGSLDSLRLVLCHGGSPRDDDVARLRERAPGVTVLTGHGTALPDGYDEKPGPATSRPVVRGFSVDPVEVERVLTGHPAVASARVAVEVDRLTAVLTPVPEKEIASRELRAFLRRALPEQLIPDDFTLATAPPEEPATGPFVAPRDPDEELLAEIWAEVLRRSRVGVTDNFFDLGGDSVRAIQVAARARAAGFDIRSEHLFEHQTVAELASACDRLPASGSAGPDLATVVDRSVLDLVQQRFGASFGGKV